MVQHMQWIKEYEGDEVDLAGDEITIGRIWQTQMLFEYGIMSTYLQRIKDQSVLTYEYVSSSGCLSFCVPSHHEGNMIQGLNVSCFYKSLGSKGKDMCPLFARISNITKGLTWVYNPMVYCNPKGDEDVVWLTYWPFGSKLLNAGDIVDVIFFPYDNLLTVSKCGVSLVYTDSEVEEDEKCDNNTMKEEEVIGGNLFEFEVASGCYYLCRRDFFGLDTCLWFKVMFDDADICYEGRWRKTHQSMQVQEIRDITDSAFKIIELGVSLNSESEMGKIEKAVSSIEGVESVSTDKEMGKLIVTGYVDPIEVATYVRTFDNVVVEIFSVKDYIDSWE